MTKIHAIKLENKKRKNDQITQEEEKEENLEKRIKL
jgi:hypothetical protein